MFGLCITSGAGRSAREAHSTFPHSVSISGLKLAAVTVLRHRSQTPHGDFGAGPSLLS